MIWIICYTISLAAFFLSAAVFIGQFKGRRSPFSSCVKTLIIGCAIAVFALNLPIRIDEYGADAFGVFKAVLMSFNRMLRAFILTDISFLDQNLSIDQSFYGVYTLTVMAFCFICPCLTVSYILTFFSKVRSGVKRLLYRNKNLYIFSQLNENSLALARDLYRNHKKDRAVFCGVSDDFKSRHVNLISEAEKIGAICLARNIPSVRFRCHSKKKKLCFFTIDADEQQNTNETLALIERYHDRDNTAIYLFSSLPESYMILSGIDHGAVKIRRINIARSCIYRFLYDRGELLFSGAADSEQEKLIHAVIVGLDRYGTEMLKALTWFCQMDGYRLFIDAFDSDSSALDRLAAQCPDLFDPAYHGKDVEGEALYTIKVYAGTDTRSVSFSQQIQSLDSPTFAFVSLGDDSADIETCVMLRTLFERAGKQPDIFTVIHSDDKKRMIENIENFRGQQYHIHSVGDIRSSYSEKEIIRSEIEQEALALHQQWGDEESFWRYEYNYQSSLTRAIHQKVCRALYPQQQDADMGLTEHKRWNAYMRTLGYTYSGSADPSSRNDLAKLHNNLVPYDQLSERDKKKDQYTAF